MADFGKNFLIGGATGQDALSAARMKQLEAQVTQAQAAGKFNNVGKVGKGQGSSDSLAEMESAATQFEALLLHQMFKAMWTTVPKDGLLTGSSEEGHYRDMLNQSLADQLSTGQGIGIKEVILRDLKKYQAD
ncbi:rod-binding protein [Oligoflexia bacterium]|nr:rod-binding protein [Oligoflexia bacterium]